MGVTSDIIIGTGNFTIRKSTVKMASGFGVNMGSTTNALVIDSAVVMCEFLKNASLSYSGESKVYLYGSNPFDANSTINITSYEAWLLCHN